MSWIWGPIPKNWVDFPLGKSTKTQVGLNSSTSQLPARSFSRIQAATSSNLLEIKPVDLLWREQKWAKTWETVGCGKKPNYFTFFRHSMYSHSTSIIQPLFCLGIQLFWFIIHHHPSADSYGMMENHLMIDSHHVFFWTMDDVKESNKNKHMIVDSSLLPNFGYTNILCQIDCSIPQQ